MKTKILTALCAATLFAGCASTTEETAVTQATGPMVDCSLPTVEGDRGPIKPTLYVVGTFEQAEWMHVPDRAFTYKGDGIYQLVREEKAGTVNLQVATMNWKPQFTAGGRDLNVGEMKDLKRGGFMKDTIVDIAQDGKYVWSVKFAEDKSPESIVIAQCAN
ncbi:glycosidase [Vibrio pelagius]|uniref:glycosidase n=1 Tax=Vibrio pelagius TaxID=28169 RepID=UPI0021C35729|nr:glycosidase [Vibrio pelagius]